MKVARIKAEVVVGITPEIEAALKNAVHFIGMTPSQYGRQAILEKLIREGFLVHPMAHKFDNSAAAAANGQ